MNYKGYTLIEMCIALATSAILLVQGIPNLLDAFLDHKTEQQITALKKQLSYARFVAINHKTRITVCPLNKLKKCSHDWQKGFSVFYDHGKMGEFETNQDRLILSQQIPDNLSLSFNGGSKIVYDPTGMLDSAAGTFQFCQPNDIKARHSKAIIVSLTGRSRLSSDIDGDGIDEKYYTKNKSDLICH